jgi:hypothetical protein
MDLLLGDHLRSLLEAHAPPAFMLNEFCGWYIGKLNEDANPAAASRKRMVWN